ncbi:hypothetical protein BDW42DRAFT_66826 [Aspergillus taichungensis]|uniref:Cytochrome P450 n=1 Tax=Aspergillus taichungensis TaxID=482145 RepID=A0A2J5I0H6_9EURO|nr:hypothetical protein BDW42DRAFT_66826 [Aspergillus taichungensis]
MDSLYFYGYAPVVLLVAVGYLATIILRIGTPPKGLPPGPTTELIWGNLKQVRPCIHLSQVIPDQGSSLINWVAAMCLNPEAQKKAQEGNIISALSTVL